MLKKYSLLLILIISSLYAQNTDKAKIQVGSMFVSTFETDMQMGKKGFPLGAKINTKDQLALESETAVFRLDGYYRFTDVHSIEYSYFSVKSDGDRFVETDFEWDGKTLSNVQANSHFNMNIYKLNYAYSFYHNKDIELALTAGLHITGLELGLKVEGEVDGVENEKFKSNSSFTAPLPVFGFKGEYTIIPNELFVNYKAEYFYIKYDVYKGLFVSNMINLEYRFMDHYGIGFGFHTNNLLLEMETSDKKVEVENTLSGWMAYLSYTF